MTKTLTRAILENAGGTTEKSANSGVCGKIFVLPFFWKRWRHPPVRGDKSAQACSHNLPLQLLWHPPLPFFNALLGSPRSAADSPARPPYPNKKTGFRKRKPVISGNPDLNRGPLRPERSALPAALLPVPAKSGIEKNTHSGEWVRRERRGSNPRSPA